MRSIRLYLLRPASAPTWIGRGGVLVVAAMAVMIGGCNRVQKTRPGWANVSGTVTYEGKPLPGGEVMWCTAKDGISIARGGHIREDGTFALDTPIGPATIAIQVADLKKVKPNRY